MLAKSYVCQKIWVRFLPCLILVCHSGGSNLESGLEGRMWRVVPVVAHLKIINVGFIVLYAFLN